MQITVDSPIQRIVLEIEETTVTQKCYYHRGTRSFAADDPT